MAAAAPGALGVRGGDVVGVGRAAGAEQLGVDAAPRLRACSSSSRTSDAGALAQDEAVAVLVERPAGAPAGSSLRVDRARAEMKPPRPIGVMAASVPPVIMTSAWSRWMARRASPMALAAEAQAVATAVFGPHRPKWIEMLPAAALAIILGMTNGLIRPGPPCDDSGRAAPRTR